MDINLLANCQSCISCGLSQNRKNIVFSRGNTESNIMVIGEAPGAQEDLKGQPFVGRSGMLLNELMNSVGINFDQDCYICNLVKCRPPNNRRPNKSELDSCRPWLNKQLELVKPSILLLLGATAVEEFLGFRGRLSKIRGEWIPLDKWLVMPLFHPAYLLRNPSLKPGSPRFLTRSDLVKVRDRLHIYSSGQNYASVENS